MNKKVMKSVGALLLAVAIAVALIPSSDAEATSATASDFQMEGTKLVKYAGTAEVVSIPDDIKIIGEEAFADNDNLVKVTFGERVESVEYGAFKDCDYLRTVVINNRTEEIDSAAFADCDQLTHVTFGENTRKIGSGAFAGDYNLSDISIDAGNHYLMLSDGILFNHDQSKIFFSMPSNPRESITIPNTVTEIMGYAFWGNTNLKRVVLGSGQDGVSAYAFSNCKNLREVIIPLPVKTIGAKAFEDCVNLRSVTMPESMLQIHDTAFDGCPMVTILASPGSYADKFGIELKKTQVEEVEYEDVDEAKTIDESQINEITDQNLPSTAVTDENQSGDFQDENDMESNELASIEEYNQVSEEIISNSSLLGETKIVSGQALVFIDNGRTSVLKGGRSASLDLSGTDGISDGTYSEDNFQSETVGDVLSNQAQKGAFFPKFTIANGKISAQAYYRNTDLSEYDFPGDVYSIGEFAFARSGLASVHIPEGVTRIGYGAFYHCDSLSDVVIPSTVRFIDAYAFDKTPFMNAYCSESNPYLVVGDGVLIGYGGKDSVINIPTNVKTIAPCVFKDHMGITAVNLPDSVSVIGDNAFSGCRNLKTVNGGSNLISIGEGAFRDCALSGVTIPASVEEIGIGAFNLSNGTDSVTFLGETLPRLITGKDSGRINNIENRYYAFGNMSTAIVSSNIDLTQLEGSVLQDGYFGFKGAIYTSDGKLLGQNDGVVNLALNHDEDSDYGSDEKSSKLMILVNSNTLQDTRIFGLVDGFDGYLVLRLKDSDEAAKNIEAAYGELYGGRKPFNLLAYDMTLYDETGTVPIKRLGKMQLTLLIPMPEGITNQNLNVVSLDEDGQLEALTAQVIELDGEQYISFSTSHFSPLGIYNYSGYNVEGTVVNGHSMALTKGNKDDTPDTGDFLHPKWFLVFGLAALSILCFLYRDKKQPM